MSEIETLDAYVQLDRFKDWANLESDETDTLASEVIVTAARNIDRHCGRPGGAGTFMPAAIEPSEREFYNYRASRILFVADFIGEVTAANGDSAISVTPRAPHEYGRPYAAILTSP